VMTGSLMYVQDYDETVMPSRNPTPLLRRDGTACRDFTPWVAHIQPYTKNWEFVRCISQSEDPFGIWGTPGGNSPSGNPQCNWALWPSYGINWNYLQRTDYSNAAAGCADNGWCAGGLPKALADIKSPAATVFCTDTKNVGDAAGYYTSFEVDSPACNQDFRGGTRYCITWSNHGWGTGGTVGELINFGGGRGQGTGLFEARHSGGGNVGFADGHVKWMTPGNLAAGTNWNRTRAYTAVQITDLNQYLWDLE
jgi:prepilin-type processing-associated H-X9-DG protein